MDAPAVKVALPLVLLRMNEPPEVENAVPAAEFCALPVALIAPSSV